MVKPSFDGKPPVFVAKESQSLTGRSAASSLNDTQVDTTRLNGGLWWIYGFVACHNFPSEMWSISYFRQVHYIYSWFYVYIIEGSLEVKLPTIWRDEKQSRAEAERRGRLEERRSEEKE